MSSQCFLSTMNRIVNQNMNVHSGVKPTMAKEKVMAYEEKSVGSTPFFKCEACPYMALAEDDIKFHLFTVHPELAKTNGLAENIQIPCPGCTSVFDAEETLRTHLRNHHKMGIKDIKKMIKSLVQIALKDAKLKKEISNNDVSPPISVARDIPDFKMPQVIEIVPDIVNAKNDLPKGVAFISVDELHRMSTPNFEKVDPKEIIQEASINIVYTNEGSPQYVNVSQASTSNPSNIIQVSSVTPDLISSIQPRIQTIEDTKLSQPLKDMESAVHNIPHVRKTEELNEQANMDHDNKIAKKPGLACAVGECHIRLKDENNLLYHRKCHQNGKLICPECTKLCPTVETLHTHLWKIHAVDMELPTCEICGFKTYQKHRLHNIHMKCHGKIKAHLCSICSRSFKNANQLSKHKMGHKLDIAPVQCSICQREFSNQHRMKVHVATVHAKVKPFKCGHCEYSAARKEQLKLHLRSHTGDKPYACDQCKYRSSDHNAMRRHKKMHTKESVYKCKHCPYSAIQSTVFASHMISKHPNINSTDLHRCPYCSFKSVNKDKYVVHLTSHADKEGIQLLIEMTKGIKTNKPSWTIPSATVKNNDDPTSNEMTKDAAKAVNNIRIQVYDRGSHSESLPPNYVKNYCTTATNETPPASFDSQVLITDLSKEDNNSDCHISESSNETLMETHQYAPPRPLQLAYNSDQSNLHGFLTTSVSMEQSLLQNTNVSSLASSPLVGNISNNIMSNFPIRLPPVSINSLRHNIMLKPVDKISLSTSKVIGPLINPTQILPVPSSSNSPVNVSLEEGVPRKKPKISVKSNLILKGPDQENMFHSQQKMAFRRLEDNERFGLGGPVTFNNLITTQFMQLQPQPALSESPGDLLPYSQDALLADVATTPVDNGMNNDPQIFSFNQQMSVNSMTLLPPPQKIQTNDPSYIKLEATIKQNTQSPSLERMCNVNLLTSSAINREYKASPPLEDIHKNMSEIKNEVKSDSFYNLALNNAATNPPILDQYLMDNIIGEQYAGHIDLSGAVLQEIPDHQTDVIEIDDNSDDNKLLPRFDINNFPLESLYLMHNDFHFLDNEIPSNNISSDVNEISRMVPEVPIINPKDNVDNVGESCSGEFANFIQGKKDPMMNTTVRQTLNKINVKNIELMKN